MRRLAKEGLVIGGGQALVVAGRFLTVWWLTRLLDPAAFGELALIQGLAALAFAFLCGPVLQAGLRFYPEALREGRLGGLHGLLRPLVIRLAWATAAIVVAGVFGWALATHHTVDALAVVAGIAIVVPDAVRLYRVNALNAARRQSDYTLWTVADALARPVGAAIGIRWLGPTAGAALAGVLAGAVLVNLVAGWLIRQEPSSASDAAWEQATRSRVWRFVVPLLPLGVMVWTVGLADRYVLAATGGTSSAGLYAAVYGLGSQGFIAMGLFGLTLFRPLFFEAEENGNAPRARKVMGAWLVTMIAGSACGVALLAFFSEPIARLCLGPEFRSAAPLLPWIGAAYTLQTLQTVFEVLLYAKHKTALLIPVQIGGAVTALALYAALIPQLGGMGAALATLGSFAVSATLAAWFGDLAGTLRAKRSASAPRTSAV